MSEQFDYIITGAGCAGSSLLVRLMDDPFFTSKRILVIDHSTKTANDRTWCFWETGPGQFESIVHHRWQKMNFYSDSFSSTLNISPYTYKMIRGIDLYEHVRTRAADHANIVWRKEAVLSVVNEAGGALVVTSSGRYTATYVFNSILFEKPVIKKGEYFLWQHFLGWVIETKTPAFDPGVATFMDFRIPQDRGTAFMYLLPLSAHTALAEYAVFSDQRLRTEEYEDELRNYIREKLMLNDYRITHSEFGMIPMTNARFRQHNGNIFNLGAAGGGVKGSTGYAFQFIQKRAAELVASLKGTGHPGSVRSPWRFRYYDGVLLKILQEKKMKGADIFASIFRHNPAERILCFLDNDSGFIQDLQIMASVPPSVFLPAGLRQLIKSI